MGMIKFNGASSKDFGVEVETFPNYVAPQKEYEAIHIPGRNGDLLIDSGTYSNVEKRYKVNMVKEPPATEVSGPVANFKSNTALPLSELKTNIDPVQDLHGYSKPWIGGAGKNLFNDTIGSHTINANTDNTITIGDVYLEANTTYTISCKQTPAPLTSFTRNILLVYFEGTNIYNSAGNDYTIKPMTFTPSVSGTYSVRIWGHTLSANTTYSEFQVEKGSTPTDWTPYENIGEITGWNGCVVSRTGVNIWDEEWELGALQWANGQPTPASDRIRSKNYNPIKPDTQYYMRTDNTVTSGVPVVFYYDKDMNLISYSESTIRNTIIESPANAVYFKLVILQTTTYESGISLNYPSTDTTYHKFVGSKHQQFFEGLMAGTYGVVDLGSLEWSYITSGAVNRFQAPLTISGAGCADNTKIANMICSGFGVSSWSNVTNLSSYNKYIAEVSGGGYVTIQDSNFTDAEAFTEAVSGIYLIYELETATEPTITQPDINGLISAFGADLNAIVFGQTVFGGTLNVTTGELTINANVFKLVNNNNIALQGSSNNNNVWRVLSATSNVLYNNKQLCNIAKYNASSWSPADSRANTFVIGGEGNLYLQLPKSVANTLSDFITYITNNDVYFYYEMATPIEIQLTAEDIKTFIGVNNIFGNSGDVTIKTNELATTYSGKMELIANWLNSASGYARLEDSYDPDYYRLAYFNQALDIENVYDEAGRVELSFICKPQKFYKSGEDPVVFTSAGKIQNRTQHTALPLLKVKTDNTDGTVSIGNSSFGISAGSGTDIIIDCELQNAYYGIENKNNYIVLNDGDFPRIEPGIQVVSFTGGVQSVEVIPRWWTV